jgi:hypothetical protein
MPDVIDYVRGQRIDPVTGKPVKQVKVGASGSPADLATAVPAANGSFFAPGFGSNLDESVSLYDDAAAPAPKRAATTQGFGQDPGGDAGSSVIGDAKGAGVVNHFSDFLKALKAGSTLIGTMGPIEGAIGQATGMIDFTGPYNNYNQRPGWDANFDAGVADAKALGIRDPAQIAQHASDYAKGLIDQDTQDKVNAGRYGDIGLEEGASADAVDPATGKPITLTRGTNPVSDPGAAYDGPSADALSNPDAYDNTIGATITRPGGGAGASNSSGPGSYDSLTKGVESNPGGASITRGGDGGGSGKGAGGGGGGGVGSNAGRRGFAQGGYVTKQQPAAPVDDSMAGMPLSARQRMSQGQQLRAGGFVTQQGYQDGGYIVNASPDDTADGSSPNHRSKAHLQQMRVTRNTRPAARSHGGRAGYADGGYVEQQEGPGANAPRPEGAPVPPAPGGAPVDPDAMGGGGAPASRTNPAPGAIADDGVMDNQPIDANEGEFMISNGPAAILGEDILNGLNTPEGATMFRELFDDVMAIVGGGDGGAGAGPGNEQMPSPAAAPAGPSTMKKPIGAAPRPSLPKSGGGGAPASLAGLM